MKKLGVIGGLGPRATAYFLELLTLVNDVEKDQGHIETIVYSKPNIPDRTKYILSLSKKNPFPEMSHIGKILKESGAEIIAIPCVTAHYFREMLEAEIGLPIIDIIEETCIWLEKAKIKKIGILATDGTIETRMFQDTLKKYHIQSVVPGKKAQNRVMNIIYENIKAGRPVEMKSFFHIADELFQEGADKILLACTELSLMKKDYGLESDYLDVLEILAKTSLRKCGYICKE